MSNVSRGETVSSIGTITMFDPLSATFRIKEEEARFCSVCCTPATEVTGDGCAISFTNLGPGDVVKWEGVRHEDGRVVAVRVVLLQPAWMTISSPEW